MRNSWLDPTQVGQFEEPRRNEIRQTVSILEEPEGIQNGEEPTAQDLVPETEALKIGPGDLLVVSIYELLTPGIVATQQVAVSNAGFATVQMLGPVAAAGLTARELELELRERLREAEILLDADAQVSVVRSHAARYSIVGAVARQGEYPLEGPDVRLLDALAVAGGIPAYIEKAFVFRREGHHGGEANINGRAQLRDTDEPRAWPRAAFRPQRYPKTAHGDSEGHGLPQDTASVEESPVPYSLSDVSSGAAGAAAPQAAGARSPAGDAGSDELGLPQQDSVGGEPVPEWNEERGKWVIRMPATRPTTGEVGEVTERPGVAETFPVTRPGPAEAEEGAMEEPHRRADAFDELAPPLRIIEIPIKQLMEGDPRYNIVIRPSDLINVPLGPVGEFSLMGNVVRPGAYSLTGRRMTVKEAIASAGGFSQLAWPARADLVRRLSKHEEQTIQLDLDAIFAGDAPDFYLKPNDLINVGTTPAAIFFAVLRNAFRFTYGMGFVYDRNFADSDTFGAREQVKERRRLESLQRGIPF